MNVWLRCGCQEIFVYARVTQSKQEIGMGGGVNEREAAYNERKDGGRRTKTAGEVTKEIKG